MSDFNEVMSKIKKLREIIYGRPICIMEAQNSLLYNSYESHC